MELRNVLIIARKEVRDSLRNRWFLFYTGAFAILTLALSYLSVAGTGVHGVAGFGRTTAGLVNLVLLIVPLMALTIAAGSLAGERERGTLGYLLAQPISRIEVVLGKYAGLATALSAALAAGFGFSGVVIAWNHGAADASGYLALVGLTCVLGLAMLSVGLLISVLARKASVATGIAIVFWFGLAMLSDLALMGSTIAFKLQISQLFELAILNPLQVFKMAALGSVHATLDVLGPAGLYATQQFGPWLALIFGASLAAWVVFPLLLACLIFVRRGVE